MRNVCKIAFLISTALFIMTSCQKEEMITERKWQDTELANYKYNPNVDYLFFQYVNIKDLEKYIDSVLQKEPIELYELAESEDLDYLIENTEIALSCFNQAILESPDPESTLASLHNLLNKINHYYDLGDSIKVTQYLNEITDIIYCNEPENNKPYVTVHKFHDFMQTQHRIIEGIESKFPNIGRLDYDKKQEYYTLALYYKEIKKNMDSKLPPTSCKSIYNAAVRSAIVSLTAKTLLCGCLGFPIAALACEAAAIIDYADKIYNAKVAYNNCIN